MCLDDLLNNQSGVISVSRGKHEGFFVRTRETPEQVLISKVNDFCSPTCDNDDSRDWFDYEIEDDGFVFYANIKSDSVQFDWIALF